MNPGTFGCYDPNGVMCLSLRRESYLVETMTKVDPNKIDAFFACEYEQRLSNFYAYGKGDYKGVLQEVSTISFCDICKFELQHAACANFRKRNNLEVFS